MGRTGRLFGYQHAGIEPDIMTLGKGIGAGVPLAALLAKEMACCFEHGDQGGTYNGNPLMCAAGLAVLEAVSSPAFLAGVSNMGAYFCQVGSSGCPPSAGWGRCAAAACCLPSTSGQPIGNDVVQMARDAGPADQLAAARLAALHARAERHARERSTRMIAVLDAVLGAARLAGVTRHP